jgi:hypothetical protein
MRRHSLRLPNMMRVRAYPNYRYTLSNALARQVQRICNSEVSKQLESSESMSASNDAITMQSREAGDCSPLLGSGTCD